MSGFWTGLGVALVVLSLCLGIGGCVYLCDAHDHPLPTPPKEAAQ